MDTFRVGDQRCDRGPGMSELDRFVNEVERSLPYPNAERDQVMHEVRDHLNSLVKEFRKSVSQDTAEAKAIEAFGTIDDFVARFEAAGGPTLTATEPSPTFGGFAGSYVGLVLGSAAVTLINVSSPTWALASLFVLAVGALAGRSMALRRNLGPLLGAAGGAILGQVAVAHYLIFRGPGPSSPSSRTILIWTTVLGALLGFAIGLIPRLRKDPSPLLWATALGLGGHVFARLAGGAETLTGMAPLAIGLVLGAAVGLNPSARRYSLVPLGGMLGLTLGWTTFLGLLLMDRYLGTSIWAYINPWVAIPIGAAIGALSGLVIAIRSQARDPVGR